MRTFILFACLNVAPHFVPMHVERELRVGAVLVPLPPGAQVVPFPHGQSRFRGTRVRLEERLTVELAALSQSAQPLKAFVDSVVATRNASLAPSWKLEPPESRVVGGRTAWVLHPHCGDCKALEVYLDFPGTRLVVAWGVDGLPPLSVPERNALAWRLVAALRPAAQSQTSSRPCPGSARAIR